jgi:hypothetical protein
MSQLGKNVQIAWRKEASLGVAPGTGSGTILRANPSPGLDYHRAGISANEFRKDGQSAMDRHGTIRDDGSYEMDLIVGMPDGLIDGLMRTTVAAAIVLTNAQFTTITITGTNLITFAAGSPISLGFRVGRIFKITGSANATNNNKWYRILAISATTITVATGSIANQGADGTPTLTQAKTWINGATPTRASYWFEQYYQDLAKGDQFGGVRVVGGKLSWGGDQMIKLGLQLMGLNFLMNQAAYFVAPALTAGTGLVSEDAIVRINGVDYADLTGLETNFNMGGNVPAVVGGNLAPDVFEGNLKVTGSVSFLTTDLVRQNLFGAATDTEWEKFVLMQTPVAAGVLPDAMSLFLPAASSWTSAIRSVVTTA